MVNPLKNALNKILDHDHGSKSTASDKEPATSSSGSASPRRSVDLSRLTGHSEKRSHSPARASIDSTRSGTASTHDSEVHHDELKHHLQKIFHIHGHKEKTADQVSATATPKHGSRSGDVTPTREAEKRKAKEAAKEQARLEREAKVKAHQEEIEAKHKAAYDSDPLKDHYGAVPLANKERTEVVQRDSAFAIGSMDEGKEIVMRARIHHIRALSAKVAFIILRQRLDTIQGVLIAGDSVSENMIKWACRLDLETIVIIKGVVQNPKAGQFEIKSTSVHHREVLIKQMHVVGTVTMKLPYHVEDVEKATYEHDDYPQTPTKGHSPVATEPQSAASGQEQATVADEASTNTETSTTHHHTPATHSLNKHIHAASKVGYSTRLENRLIDLRSDVSQAVFRIQAAVAKYFRRYLDDHGFMEIHTSKMQGGATESGASVFKVDYFGRTVFLAQSPQLGKQMAIASDFERVYEIGPVFRAENSNTHRHLTEFTGLDLEMAIEDHYHEVVDMLDGALKAVFRGLQSDYRRELDTVRKLYPSEDLVFPEKTLRLHYRDGVQMLRDAGWTDDGHEIDYYEDFSTRTEKKLGELVKEKFGTDYYILDKFPLSARPFYTMPDPEDPKRTNACDFFVRGEEILSGGQRIHQAPFLEQRMRECGVNPDIMKDYVDGFRQGCPPHGGGGIGLERLVFLFLKLGNIRWATLMPRDPRSFPKAEQDKLAEAVVQATNPLLGPVANTLEFEKAKHSGQNPAMPKLEDLIAAYGDSPNTSWLDPFWTVWHHSETGAACGYAVSDKYALIWGRPLCDDTQILDVAKAFHAHLKEKHLKPIWACVDDATETVLSERMGWRCVVAVAEQRVDPVTLAAEGGERSVRHKANRAQKDGVVVAEKEGFLTDEEAEEIVQRMKEWQQNRHGTQVYSAGLYPFVDREHRRYFVARNKDKEICGLVVLAQLAREHGFQVKYSLDFPNAPAGTIELIVSTALQSLGRAGVHAATFGGSAPEALQPVGNDWGWRVRMLTRSYAMITKTFRLTDKASFREKFGTKADPQYVCYPPGGLGLKGIEAIMTVLKTDKGGGDRSGLSGHEVTY